MGLGDDIKVLFDFGRIYEEKVKKVKKSYQEFTSVYDLKVLGKREIEVLAELDARHTFL